MEIAIGIILILTFVGLAIYAIRGGSLFMGILIMASLWTIIPSIGNAFVKMGYTYNPGFYEANRKIIDTTFLGALEITFQKGAESWGATLVNVCFGAWFGRVILDTGIASTLIKKTTELGGDRPSITCILLSIVTTLIFTSLFGVGAVVAIGVIILPILISLGIPKRCAIVSYMMSIGAGMFLNPVLNDQYKMFFKEWSIKEHALWGVIMMLIQMLFIIVIIIFFTRKRRMNAAWAVEAPKRSKLDFAPTIALISPILPVILNFLGVPIILGFLLSGFYSLAVCRRLKSFKEACRILNKTFFDGVVDIAPLVGFLLVIPMFNASASLCSPYFQAVLGGLVPGNLLMLVIIVSLLAPLALFRGPLTLFGCGAALLAILQSFKLDGNLLFPWQFLAPLFIITTTVMNVSCDITQSWIAWGIGYTKVSTRDFLKTTAISGWILVIAMELITYLMYVNHVF